MKLTRFLIFTAAPLVLEANTFIYTPIPFPGSPDTRALGINSSGTVLVDSLAYGVGDSYYLWKDGISTPVTLPFTIPFSEGGINDNGAITGNYSSTTGGGAGGFILNSGLTLFVFPGALRTDAHGINDSDSVVGFYFGPSGDTQGYIRSSRGSFSTIDVPNSTVTEADGINNTGDIVGFYQGPAIQLDHGFLLRDGVFTDILYPLTIYTRAHGINDLGDIVGEYTDSQSRLHGFVLSGGVYSTVDFPGAVFTAALGINDSGSIVGLYGTPNSIEAFIASPVPEPGTLPVLAGCLIGLKIARPRKSVLSRRQQAHNAGTENCS